MPKNAKATKTAAKKTPAKKSIAKPSASAKAQLISKLQRQSSLMNNKTSAKKPAAAPKKAKATKDWEPGYTKTIKMFKGMGDYFQLNEGYKGA